MVEAFRAPVGTRDILAPESGRWQVLVARFAETMAGAGYRLALGPVFEDAAVFRRVGESTDVVRKEMYELDDRGGRRLALRPESTASLVRAYAERRPPLPFKAWYAAAHFRYERPQAGRFRQHHQLGAEALGPEDPDLDVEVVSLAWGFLARLGLRRVRLRVNSMGDDVCRPGYVDAVRAHLAQRVDQLCEEHGLRALENPLRVLDCKREACRRATQDAPRATDHLCQPCRAHFERVLAGLDALGVPCELEPRLVRGLDYYTRTAFELQADAIGSAQDAIGGGGRYDKLAEALGGPPTPGIGFGLGVERVLLACDAEGVFETPEVAVAVWVVDTAGGSHARDITASLRNVGIAADRSFDGRSMKAQFKAADRSGAGLAVVIGGQEAAEGTAIVRDLRLGEQETVRRDDLVAEVEKRL